MQKKINQSIAKKRLLFIAEIGMNHNGNFDLCYELMRKAKARAHFLLYSSETPFRSRKEVDRKKRGKRGYNKHKTRYV